MTIKNNEHLLTTFLYRTMVHSEKVQIRTGSAFKWPSYCLRSDTQVNQSTFVRNTGVDDVTSLGATGV